MAKNKNKKTLEELLEIWHVQEWDEDDDLPDFPKGWFGVSNDDGIIAYFGKKEDAFKFRLSKINDILNG